MIIQNGNGIHQTSISDHRLKRFLENGETIRYEEMFYPDNYPSKVVYWAVSDTRGWAERVEFKI